MYGITITTADGRKLRYAGDEASADGVPEALNYTSTIPGGHDTCTFNLRTKITRDLPFSVLDDVRVWTTGNRTLWEGMITQLPRQSGDDFLVNVQCVGHSARLKWDTGFRETYVNRDLNDWQSPPTQYMLDRITSAHGAGEVASDTAGGPEVRQTIAGLGSSSPVVTSMYKSTVDIGGIYWQLRLINGGFTADANYSVVLGLDNDDTASAFTESTGNQRANVNGGASLLSAGGTGRRYAFAYWLYGAASTWAATYGIAWKLSVFGNHGLTKRGTGIDQGFYGHDVIANIVSRAGGGLTTDGVEENSSFVIPHLNFPDVTTGEEALLETNKFYLWEWGVWDDKDFFWRPADPDRLCWEARLDEGTHVNLEGDEAANAVNGVIVNYSIPDGTAKTAGPTGSGMDVTDASLGDTSADNPVNARGIAKKYARLDVSTTTLDSGAIALGAAYLAQTALPARKGSITLTGFVNHPTAGPRPVGEVRAGDWIRIPDSSSNVARRIVQANHDADTRVCTVDVGNDVDKVDAILQRVGVQPLGSASTPTARRPRKAHG